jgi:hypothetical protein
MTLITGITGTGVWIGYFGLLNPSTATQALTASWGNALNGSMCGLTLSGCGGFASNSSNVTGTSHTLVMTGASGNLNVVSAAAASGTITSGPSITFSWANVYSDTGAGFPCSTSRGRSQPSLTWTCVTSASVACLMVGVECQALTGNGRVLEYYFLNTAAKAPNFWGVMQDGGSPPAGMNSGTVGWTVATTVAYWRARLGATALATVHATTSYIDAATGPTPGTGATNTTAGDSFVTALPYNASFAAGIWYFEFAMGPTTHTSTGCVRFRLWASTNYNGVGARELTSGAQACAINTMSTNGSYWNSWVNWNAPAITLNNEYLFVQVEFQTTTAGTVSGANALFFVGVDQYALTPPMSGGPAIPVGGGALMVGL